MKRIIAGMALLSLVLGAAKAKDERPAWTDDLSKMQIPDAVACGRIHGHDFKVDRAELKNGVLTLRQGGDFFPDLAIDVMMFLKQGENPEGKQLSVPTSSTAGKPWIRLQWRKVKGKGMPETELAQRGYALQLELGQRKAGRLPGRIYLCMPDQAKSVVAGTFEVVELDRR